MTDVSVDHPFDQQLDARELACPLPLLKAKQAISGMQVGQVLWLLATDAGSQRDIRRYAELSGHILEASETFDGEFHYWLRKSGD
ncbi:sulfurtransferase TusA family protein [Halopseudomonas yangmingensis]|uniref:TusA-related sulfurtransferase n=1 Tax=Halopseudomonas yangmingensis TaxID=1720063 RepID=A0A1I4NH53_9GAMM|nr:sulfurtransferase TusA family protein [Halopseudomonas yangmingensis]SFM14818.1 TusA-related sulfurtransferase [Halopseudomonas yangmingensis]